MRLSFKGCSGMCLTNDDIRTRTGKEAKSVKRIMAKLQSPSAALEALATLINK